MAKPIALFSYPDQMFDLPNERKTAVDIIQTFNKAMPDYHWLCFPALGIRFPKLQVFFEKDMEEIEYEELVDMIKKKLEKLYPEK
jgi:hypothetical protein